MSIIQSNKEFLLSNDINNENISSIMNDYFLFNSFIQSNKFKESIELYSILTNICNNKKLISLKNLIKQIEKEYSYLLLNELKQLNKIFEKLNIRLLINSFDLINKYNLNQFKIIYLKKEKNQILGITIRYASLNDHRILCGRIISGTIAEKYFSIGDEFIQINNENIQFMYKTLEQIIQFIDSLYGYISFLIIPNQQKINHQNKYSSIYVRSLFEYNSSDDIYIPCKELGLQFKKDQILKIVNRDDPLWYQAILIHNNEKQILPGLIPSPLFQKKRLQFLNYLHKQIIPPLSLLSYERVKWFIPNEKCKRPIILIGASNIIGHKFRKDLINSIELSSLIGNVISHTTRLKKDNEINGIDFHFITYEQFKYNILNNLFIKYGFYKGNLYGISKLSIQKSCQLLNKICILNLNPEEINRFKYSNIYPYVIYLKISSSFDELSYNFNLNENQFIELKQIDLYIENKYSNLFDKTIILNKSYENILSQLKFLIKDIQNKSMWINQFWFSIK